ncbi:hypothetical protein AWB65_05269 [Caballeronia humi]|uniref:Glycosyltransferase RgtA/B/C/D-like domain-containing protein n=2 Tax=Caballeronia humi TaxID=326474 RepID=A0A158IR64_9BURK|nr:hypothetical protein AWB65_05269 [Caballeronia humi]
MKIARASISALLAVLAGSVLLYPYFRASLQLQGVGHAYFVAAAAAATVAVAAAMTVVLAPSLFTKCTFWVVAILLGGFALVRHGPHPGGAGASAAVALLKVFVVALFTSALWVRLRAALAPLRRGELLHEATFWNGVAVWALVVANALLWFSMTQFIWFWDYVGYADLAASLADALHGHGWLSGAHAVAASLNDEYNLVPAIPLAMVESLFGSTDRVVLILAIAMIYTGPTVLAMAWLLYRSCGGGLNGRMALCLTVIAMSLFPVNFFSSLYGMPDIGGVALIAAVTAMLYSVGPGDNEPHHRTATLVLCAGLLFLLCVFRRWYLFIVPPLMIVIGIRELLRIDAGRGWRVRLMNALRSMSVFISFLALCGFAYYWERVVIMARARYTDAYSAYWTTMAGEISKAAKYLGYGPVALCVMVIVAMAFHTRTRATAIAVAFMIVATLLLFTRVQGLGLQHYLLVLPAFSFAVATAVAHLYMARPRLGMVAMGVLLLCSVAAVSSVFHPASDGRLSTSAVLPTIDMRPPRRADMPELQRLVHDVEAHAENGHFVCIAASGVLLNQSIVVALAKMGDQSRFSQLWTHFTWLGDVDRRDGPALSFPNCEYVVVTDPPSTHLSVMEQQVVAYLSTSLLSGSGLGASYEPTGQKYRLAQGYCAFIYRKIKAIPPDEWQRYLTAVTQK